MSVVTSVTFFTSLGNMELSFSKLTAHIDRKQNLMSVNVMGIDLQYQITIYSLETQ